MELDVLNAFPTHMNGTMHCCIWSAHLKQRLMLFLHNMHHSHIHQLHLYNCTAHICQVMHFLKASTHAYNARKQKLAEATGVTLDSCPAKMTAPYTNLVLRRLEPRSSREACDSGTVCSSAWPGRHSTRLPVKVYNEALGCSHRTSACNFNSCRPNNE